MNEDQLNDEVGADPRPSNGQEPTLKTHVDANGKVIVRCKSEMYAKITFFHQ